MSNIILKSFLLISLLSVSMTALSDSIEEATEDDISMLLDAASGKNSASWATYIGHTKNKVYFEYGSMIHASSLFTDKPNHVVYWIPLNKLSNEKLNMFIEYKKNNINLK